MYKVTKCAVQEALIDLGTAFNNFFAGERIAAGAHGAGNGLGFFASVGEGEVSDACGACGRSRGSLPRSSCVRSS